MDPTTHYKACPQCQTPAPLQAAQCAHCGRHYRTQFAPPDQTVTFPASEGPGRSGAYLPPPVPYQQPQAPTHYQPPAYEQPWQPPAEARTDVCGILSVVFGGVGVLFCPLVFSIAGLVLGIVSLYRVKELGLKGKPLAIIGTSLSGAGLAWGLIWFTAALLAPSGS